MLRLSLCLTLASALLSTAFGTPLKMVAPVIITSTTTTTMPTTTIPLDSTTLYLSHYYARDGQLANTYCDASADDSAHSIMTVRTYRCTVFPGLTQYGIASYYYLSEGPGTDQYIMKSGCNSYCQGCSLASYTLTLGVCANSLDFPNNESVLLTSNSCEGGLYSSSLASNALSVVHTPYSSSCQFNDTDEIITNLGPANGACLMVHGMYAKVESTGDNTYSLWWNCNSYCAGCTFTKLNMTFDTCLTRPQIGLPGTLQVRPTNRLSICGPEPESAQGLSTAAIVGIVVGSVVGVVGLIGLGLWLARRSRRQTYQVIDH
jgi:hypothetical protein